MTSSSSFLTTSASLNCPHEHEKLLPNANSYSARLAYTNNTTTTTSTNTNTNSNNSFTSENENLLELTKNIQKNKKKKLLEKFSNQAVPPLAPLCIKHASTYSTSCVDAITLHHNHQNHIQQQPSATQHATKHENNKFVKVRFLLFAEDSAGCRSNIFDSSQTSLLSSNNCADTNKSYKNMDLPSSPPQSSSTTTTLHGQSPKLNNDTITRMVFGSLPMVVSNRTAFKVGGIFW